MKEITFPPLLPTNSKGAKFGLAEYLTDIVFTRVDLLADQDFCKLVGALYPPLHALRGPAQVGLPFRLTDAFHTLLLSVALPVATGQLNPEMGFAVAQWRLALAHAVEVEEKQPVANGASREASPS